MKPFKSATQMIGIHQGMFGEAGRVAAETVLDLAPRLFAAPIDPLSVRVVFAPYEIGAYNNHTGYNKSHGEQTFILGNRHQCQFCGDELVIQDPDAQPPGHAAARTRANGVGLDTPAAAPIATKAGIRRSPRPRRPISATNCRKAPGRSAATRPR